MWWGSRVWQRRWWILSRGTCHGTLPSQSIAKYDRRVKDVIPKMSSYFQFPLGTECCMWPWTRHLSAKTLLASRASYSIQIFVLTSPMKQRTGYGAPLSRRRLYLLLIQEAALTDEASQMDFMDFIHKKLKAMHLHPTTTKWFLDLLPCKVAGGS